MVNTKVQEAMLFGCVDAACLKVATVCGLDDKDAATDIDQNNAVAHDDKY